MYYHALTNGLIFSTRHPINIHNEHELEQWWLFHNKTAIAVANATTRQLAKDVYWNCQ